MMNEFAAIIEMRRRRQSRQFGAYGSLFSRAVSAVSRTVAPVVSAVKPIVSVAVKTAIAPIAIPTAVAVKGFTAIGSRIGIPGMPIGNAIADMGLGASVSLLPGGSKLASRLVPGAPAAAAEDGSVPNQVWRTGPVSQTPQSALPGIDDVLRARSRSDYPGGVNPFLTPPGIMNPYDRIGATLPVLSPRGFITPRDAPGIGINPSERRPGDTTPMRPLSPSEASTAVPVAVATPAPEVAAQTPIVAAVVPGAAPTTSGSGAALALAAGGFLVGGPVGAVVGYLIGSRASPAAPAVPPTAAVAPVSWYR